MVLNLSPKAIRGIVAAVTITTITVVGYLSPHFTIKEATVTQTGIVNIPNQQQLNNMKVVLDSVVEPARNHFGYPIYISSGFRNEAVNKAVKGAPGSQHLRGEAFDLDCDIYGHITNEQLYRFIHDSLQYDQLIMEGGPYGWVHVSYKLKGNRHQSLYILKP